MNLMTLSIPDKDSNFLIWNRETGNLNLRLRNELYRKPFGRSIGKILQFNDVKVYYKNVDEEDHVFHKNNGIGINYKIIEKLLDEVDVVRATITNGKGKKKTVVKELEIIVKEFKTNAIPVNFKNKNHGCELQLVCPIENWKELTVKL